MALRSKFDPSRRRLLFAGAATVALAACGGESSVVAPTSSAATGGAGAERLTLLRVFSPEQPAGAALRLPFAFADGEGVPTGDVPERIQVAAVSPSGEELEPVVVERRGSGIPTPYFPYQQTLGEVGTWALTIAAGEERTETTLTVRERHELPVVPGPGDRLPSIPTPTFAEPLGIDPICTANPACPFHEVPLDEALAGGRPVVLLVSTPAFCQTAICGPVLDLLVDRRDALAGRTVIHAEVYTDETARQTAPIVDALGLRYEPALFVADANGVVAHRLDYTFDATELDAVLA